MLKFTLMAHASEIPGPTAKRDGCAGPFVRQKPEARAAK
jgi:hypothetical protein